jgi:hypothetical protein
MDDITEVGRKMLKLHGHQWNDGRHNGSRKLVEKWCNSTVINELLCRYMYMYIRHRFRQQNIRSRIRIPPGCKVFRNLYNAVLLS